MSKRPASGENQGMQLVIWLVELLHVRIRIEILAALARAPKGERDGESARRGAGDAEELGMEADVSSLAMATGREVSHVSQHLVQLLAAGLLERRIVWKRHHYRLADGVSVDARGDCFVVEVRRPDGRVCRVSALAPPPITTVTDRRGADHDRAGRAG